MLDLIGSILVWNVVAVLFVGLVYAVRRNEVNVRWLLYSLVMFSLYMFFSKQDIVPLMGFDLSPSSARLNIDGKIVGSILALFLIVVTLKYCSPCLSAAKIGLTMRQNKGSFLPAIAVTIGLAIVAFVLARFVGIGGSGGEFDSALLTLYPFIAGFDEELMFRGLLLVAFSIALPGKGIVVAGVPISIGGLIALLLYSIIHGLKIKNGLPAISPPGIVLTLFYGGVFLWLKEKTGSLLMPIASHNLVNTIGWLV